MNTETMKWLRIAREDTGGYCFLPVSGLGDEPPSPAAAGNFGRAERATTAGPAAWTRLCVPQEDPDLTAAPSAVSTA
jgi:hypothetical protein